jgi:heterogeneous nuclear ribonucleoprotein A1/A3
MGKSEYGGSGGGGGGSGSPGKIFVGGLPRDTTLATFQKHFGAYGEIVDSVIMKNKHTSQPRGFGFITYADPAVVDTVMEDNHVINGKQVSSLPSTLLETAASQLPSSLCSCSYIALLFMPTLIFSMHLSLICPLQMTCSCIYIYITKYVISSLSDILLLLYVRLHINHMLNTWFYTL